MKESNLKTKELIIIAVVVSSLTAVFVCSVIGIIGYNFLKQEPVIEQNETYISTDAYEESVVAAVDKAAPAVVSIIVTKDLPIIEEYYDSFWGMFFPRYLDETEEREVGGGTGFIITSDGLILTNKHVVEDEEADYTVLTNDGEKISAEVIARDPIQDIAILKIDKTGLSTIQLGNSDEIKTGQTVIAIGNSLGEFSNTVSVGVISGLRRSITAINDYGESEELSEVIQTDAAINQGNSGGPLLNLKGEAIAINVAMAQMAENVGFALPINIVKRDVDQVIREGKITYPFLGVRYILITPEVQKENNLSVGHGALIVRGENMSDLAVVPGSPADKADLEENDIILEINGEKINSDNPLADVIQEYGIGERISLKILHKGEEKEIQVELEERK
jgi:serine protease Do